MQRLPLELQRHLFTLLSVKDIAKLSLTCKHWLNCAFSIPTELKIESATQIYGLCGVLQEHEQNGSYRDYQTYSSVSGNCLRSRYNLFIECASSTLTKLDLSYAKLENDSLLLLTGLTSLRILNLEGSLTLFMTDPLLPLSHFSQLRALNISHSLSMSRSDFYVLSNLTNLEVLNMSAMSAALDLNAIVGLTKLKEIDLSGNSYITSSNVLLLSYLTALEVLRIEDCRNLVGHGRTLEDSTIMALSGLTNLTRFDIYYCHGISDAGLLRLGANQNQLKRLTLSHCEGFTCDGLKYLCHTLTHLQELKIPSCRQITDEGVSHILNSPVAPHLLKLDLSGLPKLTHCGLEHITKLVSIVELRLIGCDSVGDTVLTDMLPTLTQLQYLDVRNCSSISENAVQAIVHVHKLHSTRLPGVKSPYASCPPHTQTFNLNKPHHPKIKCKVCLSLG